MKYLALILAAVGFSACQPLGPSDNPLLFPAGNDLTSPESMGRFGAHSELFFHN